MKPNTLLVEQSDRKFIAVPVDNCHGMWCDSIRTFLFVYCWVTTVSECLELALEPFCDWLLNDLNRHSIEKRIIEFECYVEAREMAFKRATQKISQNATKEMTFYERFYHGNVFPTVPFIASCNYLANRFHPRSNPFAIRFDSPLHLLKTFCTFIRFPNESFNGVSIGTALVESHNCLTQKLFIPKNPTWSFIENFAEKANLNLRI